MLSRKNDNTQTIKESQTLDKKHKEITRKIYFEKDNINKINNDIEEINNLINNIDKDRNNFTIIDLKKRAELLNKRDNLEIQKRDISENFEEMDYYDKTGDIIIQYYELKNSIVPVKETKNILDFLNGNKKINVVNNKDINKSELFEKYWKITEGVRINQDDGSKRIKYCLDCNIEKILDYSVSAYICQCCGETEEIILDEDRQIKDYSPYRRINHFREWLNQFQAKQSPEIPDCVYIDTVNELNKYRITDYSELNKAKMKQILKKLGYNSYYEHIHYIINKLSNLPPPKITRDMEKIFIKMFTKIEGPWLKYKKKDRKNFLSYSYVLYKFCELLELDHLLECFTLHKDGNKIMENDEIWKKICEELNWEYIDSFK